MQRVRLDDADRQLLELLDEDARMPASELAKRSQLSATTVQRRIDRMKKEGVILKFSVVVDWEQLEGLTEAYVEVQFNADIQDPQVIFDHFPVGPQIREAATLTGDPDALVRVRTGDLDELRETVAKLRGMPGVARTKTLIVLGRHLFKAGSHALRP